MPPAPPAPPARRGKRASLGVVDDTFLASRNGSAHLGGVSAAAAATASANASSTSGAGGRNALKEMTLSQQRNKALARLGQSADAGSSGMVHQPAKGRMAWLFNLLPCTFRDPEVEEEYRQTAYLMHRPFIVWTFTLFAILYCVVMISGIIWDVGLDDTNAPSTGVVVASAALRGFAAAASMLVALGVLTESFTYTGASAASVLAMLLLWLAPQVAQRLRGYVQEVPELLLLYLAAHTVLCPALHMRTVLACCLGLTALQLLMFMSVSCERSANDEAAFMNINLREVLKGVVANCLGMWLARRAEHTNREIFLNAKLFQEELMLRKAVCSDVQRLLLNTLPEPIVREIATGTSKVAHRYETVTVLQADMVGFTPLSAARGPEEVLGILSELFADFDRASERWGVHKVKTIGDAYIVCCGAFICVDDQREATRRVISMALSMQQIVAQKAFSAGADISVRVGIHTGMVIGGIIGNVRFHFDMWGNGVAGAVRMEELGTRGRVHISDSAAQYIDGLFPLEIKYQNDTNLLESFGIATTYLVQETELKLDEYAMEKGTVSEEYDFSEVIGIDRAKDVEMGIDEMLVGADGIGKKQRRGSVLLQQLMHTARTLLLWSPKAMASRASSSAGAVRKSKLGGGAVVSASGGHKNVTNAIAFMKALTEEADDDEQGSSSSLLGGATIGGPMRLSKHPKTPSRSSAVSSTTEGAADDHDGAESKHASQADLSHNFFVKKAEKRHSFSNLNAAEKAIAKKASAESDQASPKVVKLSLTRHAELLLLLACVLGLYDLSCVYFGVVTVGANDALSGLMLVRYAALVPCLSLMRMYLAGAMQRPDALWGSFHTDAASLALIILPCLALFGAIATVGDVVRPCAHFGRGALIPPCPSVAHLPPSMPPSAPGAAERPAVPSRVCALDGVADGYCRTGLDPDYVRTVGMLLWVCSYVLVHAKLTAITFTTMMGATLGIACIIATQRYLMHGGNGGERYRDAAWGLSDASSTALWWLLAHLVGMLHYRSRVINMHQQALLRRRHHRLLASIREETEHCEQLLKNILPPHVLKQLSFLMASAKSSGPPKTIAERYQGCSFLFAKIGGLSKLVNDDTVAPREMMHCLQIMFDRFDKLADMFGVQKVRKTANEYYLVAAGLPDPDTLPSAEDRAYGIAGYAFAMINIMNIINLELKPYGIEFSCQCGIHSGSAIAGVIGHRTFQYDLCGDAVNTAARMCSYSKPGHVNVSEDTYQLLKTRYGAVPRGELEVKGKGKMHTYFLLNMPVEQQEALHASLLGHASSSKAPSKSSELHAASVSVVDRWAVKKVAFAPPEGASPNERAKLGKGSKIAATSPNLIVAAGGASVKKSALDA